MRGACKVKLQAKIGLRRRPFWRTSALCLLSFARRWTNFSRRSFADGADEDIEWVCRAEERTGSGRPRTVAALSGILRNQESKVVGAEVSLKQLCHDETVGSSVDPSRPSGRLPVLHPGSPPRPADPDREAAQGLALRTERRPLLRRGTSNRTTPTRIDVLTNRIEKAGGGAGCRRRQTPSQPLRVHRRECQGHLQLRAQHEIFEPEVPDCHHGWTGVRPNMRYIVPHKIAT